MLRQECLNSNFRLRTTIRPLMLRNHETHSYAESFSAYAIMCCLHNSILKVARCNCETPHFKVEINLESNSATTCYAIVKHQMLNLGSSFRLQLATHVTQNTGKNVTRRNIRSELGQKVTQTSFSRRHARKKESVFPLKKRKFISKVQHQKRQHSNAWQK